MSRIGKQPIAIPAGVEVTVAGTVLNVKKGKKRNNRLYGELIGLFKVMQSLV